MARECPEASSLAVSYACSPSIARRYAVVVQTTQPIDSTTRDQVTVVFPVASREEEQCADERAPKSQHWFENTGTRGRQNKRRGSKAGGIGRATYHRPDIGGRQSGFEGAGTSVHRLAMRGVKSENTQRGETSH